MNTRSKKEDIILSNRQSQILKLIVELYIKTISPVGSKSLIDKIDSSSATIRNEMVELENQGLLEKTHTSSGRVPSEKGYRYYVDNLMEAKDITGEDMLKLQTVFKNSSLELNDIVKESIELISEMTNYTSVILGDDAGTNKLKKIELVPLEDKALIIIITNLGIVENQTVEINSLDIEEIKKTIDLLNGLLIGTPINEINTKLELEIKPIIGNYIKQHEFLYNTFYHAFENFSNKYSSHFSGKTRFLSLPEFNNVEKLKNIMEKFDDKELIHNIKATNEGIEIYIGNENDIDPELAIITTKCIVNGIPETIIIFGPKRMEYERIIAMLNYIRESIER